MDKSCPQLLSLRLSLPGRVSLCSQGECTVYGLRNSAGDEHLGCAGLGWAVYVGSRAHMSECMGSADEGVPSSPLGSAWVLCAPTCLALGW